jgi:hypothetical protein
MRLSWASTPSMKMARYWLSNISPRITLPALVTYSP